MSSAPLSPPNGFVHHPEQAYLDLMRQIWASGSERVDRTGVGTRSIAGAMLRFDLADGAMPLLTTKRVYWKTATREMLWFLTGETNIRPLVLQGVKMTKMKLVPDLFLVLLVLCLVLVLACLHQGRQDSWGQL